MYIKIPTLFCCGHFNGELYGQIWEFLEFGNSESIATLVQFQHCRLLAEISLVGAPVGLSAGRRQAILDEQHRQRGEMAARREEQAAEKRAWDVMLLRQARAAAVAMPPPSLGCAGCLQRLPSRPLVLRNAGF